jgi:predicted RNase H-like HicB family nuclease
MKHVYPVIFSKEDDGSFCVYAPDFPGCITEASSWAEGIEKIRDGICGMLYIIERDKMNVPAPSDPSALTLEPSDVAALVDVDIDEYKRRIGSRAVRRTISIPEWMDEKATRAGVSLSQVTQDALRQTLNL